MVKLHISTPGGHGLTGLLAKHNLIESDEPIDLSINIEGNTIEGVLALMEDIKSLREQDRHIVLSNWN